MFFPKCLFSLQLRRIVMHYACERMVEWNDRILRRYSEILSFRLSIYFLPTCGSISKQSVRWISVAKFMSCPKRELLLLLCVHEFVAPLPPSLPPSSLFMGRQVDLLLLPFLSLFSVSHIWGPERHMTVSPKRKGRKGFFFLFSLLLSHSD